MVTKPEYVDFHMKMKLGLYTPGKTTKAKRKKKKMTMKRRKKRNESLTFEMVIKK